VSNSANKRAATHELVIVVPLAFGEDDEERTKVLSVTMRRVLESVQSEVPDAVVASRANIELRTVDA
jgi:succinylglutamate desuccinylase